MKYFTFALVICSLGAVLAFNPHASTKDVENAPQCSFIFSEDSIQIDLSKYNVGDTLCVQDTIDLRGSSLFLPHGFCIRVDKGLFKNGSLVGDMNYLDYKGTIFDKVHIKGTWLVPVIRTSMFADLKYENSLKDVFALSNPEINNSIIIEDGQYVVNALSVADSCIAVKSNTDVTLDGVVSLIPNGYPGCSIFRIIGNNVSIHGQGAIVGDKHDHTDNIGEWGMGIYIDGGKNVQIKDILIKDCWGDCVYITNDSQDVLIDGCFLDHGRRQGISVISADNVVIDNCTITNVGGTAPQYAIDVEPNDNDTVGFVLINNVKVSKCKGGFMCYGKADQAHIGTIKITNSTIDSGELCPLYFDKASSVIIERTKVINSKEDIIVICDNIDSVRINHNIFNYKREKCENRVIPSEAIVIKAREQFIEKNLIN